MNSKHRRFFASALLFMVALLAFPGQALAQTPSDDGDGQVIFGGSYRLEKGETLDGGLAVFGGQATLEENSRVNGDIVLMGGALDIDGEVNGDINAFGGTVTLEDHAIVRGDINAIGATLKRSEKAVVQGTVNTEQSFRFSFVPRLMLPNLPPLPSTPPPVSGFDLLKPIVSVLWAIFQALALAALAALVTLMAPKTTERVAQSIMAQPAVSAAMGLLTLIVAPAFILLLVITIILIPVGILGFLLVGVALIFGWIALGLELGQRIAGMFKVEWMPPVSAGIGALTLTLVVRSIDWIPCIGWLAPFLVGIVGLGGVVISRFGTRFYSPAAPDQPPLPPAPPAAPEPPTGPLEALPAVPPGEEKAS